MRRSILSIFKILNPCQWIIAGWVLASGCSTGQLPAIRPVIPANKPAIIKSCSNLFLKKEVQFVHALEVRLPGHNTASVIGITQVNPANRTLESVIMTVEGLVVFHARFAGADKEILKHIDPFTSERFSDGLQRDTQLIFFIPDGRLIQLGQTINGSSICRYQIENGNLVDVQWKRGDGWKIRQYNANHHLTRTVFASLSDVDFKDPLTAYPQQIILESTGMFGYSIIMNLLRAEYITQTP